jgi:hypothetical protein
VTVHLSTCSTVEIMRRKFLSLALRPLYVNITHAPDGRKSNAELKRIRNRQKPSTKIDRPPAVRITYVHVIPIMPDDLKNAGKYEYYEGTQMKT